MMADLSFIFITDEQLRTSLEADYRELQTCLGGGAWKAAHVLSGAIVEAVLVDYLLSTGYSAKDPLKMTLEELIKAAKGAGALSAKSADLSTVVRGFRNLIHPGRVLRLKETVDEEGARIADALVVLIVREVAAKQEEVFGLTAEQLLAKFESDPTALPIASHLLDGTRTDQFERLLLSLLPERYIQLATSTGDADFDDLFDSTEERSRLERLFVEAYRLSPESVQAKVAKRFVAVVREESGWRVELYEDRFFRGYFLKHLAEAERRLVKAHILSRLKGDISPAQIAALEGLSEFLTQQEITPFFDPLIRTFAGSDKTTQGTARARIVSEYDHALPEALHENLSRRFDSWVEFLRERQRPEDAGRVDALRARLFGPDDDIPF